MMHIRGIVATLVLGLAVASFSADKSKERLVTYSSTRTLELICADLSKQTGRNVHVSPQLAKEVGCVRVSACQLDELLANLAAASHASLRKSGSDYTIERPIWLQQKLEKASSDESLRFTNAAFAKVSLRLKEIPQGVAGMAALFAKIEALAKAHTPGSLIGFGDRHRWIDDHSPLSRLLDRTILELGASAFQRIKVGNNETIVLGSTPQQASCLKLYLTEQGQLAAMIAEKLPKAPQIIGSTKTDRIAHAKPIPQTAKITLELTRRTASILHADITVMDTNGVELDSQDRTYEGEKFDFSTWENYKLPAWAKSIKPMTTLPKPSRYSISNPESIDPLGNDVGEFLIHASKDANLQLAAIIPDSAKTWMDMAALKKNLSVKEVLGDLAHGADMSFEAKGKFLIARPIRPLQCESNRLDRTALGNYLRAGLARKLITIDDLALVTFKTKGVYDDFVCPSLREAYSLPYEFQGVHKSKELLYLLGALSPANRKALAKGDRLLLSDLDESQLELAAVYWNSKDTLDPTLIFSAEPPKRLPPFPDRPSNSAYIQMKESEEKAWAMIPRDGRAYPISPSFFYAAKILLERKAKEMAGFERVKFYPIFRKARTYTIDLGEGLRRATAYIQTGKPDKSKPFDFESALKEIQLPDDTIRKLQNMKSNELLMIIQEAFMVSHER